MDTLLFDHLSQGNIFTENTGYSSRAGPRALVVTLAQEWCSCDMIWPMALMCTRGGGIGDFCSPRVTYPLVVILHLLSHTT